ncbi:MAG: thiosulfate oxidation carrier complex protein SoxZ [Alphaproteobacteria bacterium]|nr:thiosulfate oxidation carrier complex protein SoxZ [Alphaproteobacteria bacterium]
MAADVKPRIKAPATAKKGETFEIKTLVTHEMESGQRKDADGKTIPRKIINAFHCKLNGREVFSAKIEPAVAANPYLSFFVRAEESGTYEFTWVDDDGSLYKAEHKIAVS